VIHGAYQDIIKCILRNFIGNFTRHGPDTSPDEAHMIAARKPVVKTTLITSKLSKPYLFETTKNNPGKLIKFYKEWGLIFQFLYLRVSKI
jgi:hypothetical protein